MDSLRAAVIGIGEMGRHHARVYAELPDVRLVAVADTDAGKLAQITRTWGATAYDDYAKMLCQEKPNLVSVCVPTSAHLRIASTCLLMGCHVLVEKPIASTIEAAEMLIDLAQQQERILAVGHIERCNPIVSAVKRHIDDGDLGTIYRISTRRVGPSPVRIRDVGVTVDLLTHDLDVARYLLQSEPVAYHAELLHANHGGLDDAVTAIVKFENGVIGSFEADWLSAGKQRSLTITGADGIMEADYLTQEAGIQFSSAERVHIGVPYEEPLMVELRSFAAAVRGQGRPAADGLDGLKALQMALAVLGAWHGIGEACCGMAR